MPSWVASLRARLLVTGGGYYFSFIVSYSKSGRAIFNIFLGTLPGSYFQLIWSLLTKILVAILAKTAFDPTLTYMPARLLTKISVFSLELPSQGIEIWRFER